MYGLQGTLSTWFMHSVDITIEFIWVHLFRKLAEGGFPFIRRVSLVYICVRSSCSPSLSPHPHPPSPPVSQHLCRHSVQRGQDSKCPHRVMGCVQSAPFIERTCFAYLNVCSAHCFLFSTPWKSHLKIAALSINWTAKPKGSHQKSCYKEGHVCLYCPEYS